MNLTVVCDKLRKINKQILELSKYTNTDLYHNHLYKEFFITECIIQYDKSFYSFSVNGKKSPKGHDFKNKSTLKGESKSSANCRDSIKYKGKVIIGDCCFEFDKQDDKARRKKILSVGSYAFGYFNGKVLVFVQYISKTSGVIWMNSRIRQKQLDKLEIITECKKKRIQLPRDSIKFSGTELLTCPGSVYLDASGKVIPNIESFIHLGKN